MFDNVVNFVEQGKCKEFYHDPHLVKIKMWEEKFTG